MWCSRGGEGFHEAKWRGNYQEGETMHERIQMAPCGGTRCACSRSRAGENSSIDRRTTQDVMQWRLGVVANGGIQMKGMLAGRGEGLVKPGGRNTYAIQRQIASGVVQLNYDAALAQEARVVALDKFREAISDRDTADNSEVRLRAAQDKDSPESLKARAEEFKQRMEASRDRYRSAFKVLKKWHDEDTGDGKGDLTPGEFRELNFSNVSAGDSYASRMISGAKYNYKQEADRQHKRGGSQKELMLGYRTTVGGLENKNQILDTNIWSWGVNQAWIEGGAKSTASFALKTDVGETVRELLGRAKITGKEFLDLINPEVFPVGEANVLWHNTEKRPTWYALELASLLDLGYRLDPEEETKLVPLSKLAKAVVSPDVEKTGVKAYLDGER